MTTNVSNTTVVVYHRQFAYPESFIVQVSWDTCFYQNINFCGRIIIILNYLSLVYYYHYQYYKLLFNYDVR